MHVCTLCMVLSNWQPALLWRTFSHHNRSDCFLKVLIHLYTRKHYLANNEWMIAFISQNSVTTFEGPVNRLEHCLKFDWFLRIISHLDYLFVPMLKIPGPFLKMFQTFPPWDIFFWSGLACAIQTENILDFIWNKDSIEV